MKIVKMSDVDRDALGLTKRNQSMFNASQAIGRMARNVRLRQEAFLKSRGMTDEDLKNIRRGSPEHEELNAAWRVWQDEHPEEEVEGA